MNLIQCAENCKYQKDGYCNLEICCNINSPDNDCPYFVSSLFNESERLSQSADTNKLD